MIPSIRLGMIVPSSNTVVEPTTAALLEGLPAVSAHFARIRVTEITLDSGSVGQFERSPLDAAAGLLAEAKVGSVCWNGTAGSWLGPGRDRATCRAIETDTGVPATTATLATLEALHALGAERYGLVTPYVADVQSRILAHYADEGFACAGDRRLDITDNFAFSTVTEATVEAMVRAVAAEGASVVLVLCTNVRGARLAARLEPELGITLIDSVSVALWGALRAARADPRMVRGWGRLFDVV